MVAELLENRGEQILRLAVVGFGVDQFVENRHRQPVFAILAQCPRPRENRLRAAHHFDVQRRRLRRRQRRQRCRVAVPVAEVAVQHGAGIVEFRAVVLAHAPLPLQRFGHAVVVVNLVDGDALIGQVQHLVVQIGVGVALGAHDLLDAFVAPARPVVRGDHDFRFAAEAVQRLVDLSGPLQSVPDQGAAQGVDVVNGGGNVLRRPEHALFGEPGVHFGGSFGARRILEDDAHAVDQVFLEVFFDDRGWRDQARRARRKSLADGRVDLAERARRNGAPVLHQRPARHRRPGVNVLGNGFPHEAQGSDDLNFARIDLVFRDNSEHAAEMIDMGVGIDHRPDRQLAQRFVGEGQRRRRGLGGKQHVEQDPAGFAPDQGHVGQVETPHLVDEIRHDFVQAVIHVEQSLALQ